MEKATCMQDNNRLSYDNCTKIHYSLRYIAASMEESERELSENGMFITGVNHNAQAYANLADFCEKSLAKNIFHFFYKTTIMRKSSV